MTSTSNLLRVSPIDTIFKQLCSVQIEGTFGREGTIRVRVKWIILAFYLEISQPNRAHGTVKCHLSSNG